MNEKIFIGIYWGPRKEDLQVCCNKLEATFKLLSSFDINLKTWYKTNKLKKGEVLTPVEITESGIKKLLRSSENFNEDGNLNIDLGFTIYLKSHQEFIRSNVLAISCGNYNDALKNSVTVKVVDVYNEDILNSPELIRLFFSEFASIWQPEKTLIRLKGEELASNSNNL